MSTLPGTVAATPTNISTAVARVAYFRSTFGPLTVKSIRWYSVGSTTNVYRVAIYDGTTNYRLTPETQLTTNANSWDSAWSGSNITLQSNTPYYIAVSVNNNGNVAGPLCMSVSAGATTGQIQVIPTAYAGSLNATGSAMAGGMAQITVTNGVLPATASITSMAAWTGGMPSFWLDSIA